MAKSFKRQPDKVERQARLAVKQQRFRDTEQTDIRNAHRMGWQLDESGMDVESELDDE